jgi:hypothetical protein
VTVLKKVAAGFLAGVLAAMTATAYADEIESVIGRTVEGTFPLKINGKRAAKDVIVLNGTSYLPVRAAGELFGYQVDFVNGEVLLDKQAGNTSGTGTGSEGNGTSGTDGAEGNEEDESPSVPPGTYSVKTSYFAVNSGKGTLAVRDGQQYLSVLVFERYLSNDGITVSVTLPGRTPVEFDYKGAYKAGVHGYNENGQYVSLSALGLKAEASGTSITLVQK